MMLAVLSRPSLWSPLWVQALALDPLARSLYALNDWTRVRDVEELHAMKEQSKDRVSMWARVRASTELPGTWCVRRKGRCTQVAEVCAHNAQPRHKNELRARCTGRRTALGCRRIVQVQTTCTRWLPPPPATTWTNPRRATPGPSGRAATAVCRVNAARELQRIVLLLARHP